MANTNRTALLNKAHRVLKQHYKPAPPPAERPLLEHMLFACCLENASLELATKVYEHLSKSFFDWNEVRVSTLTELSEAMQGLPDPMSAASNLKKILQGVFESTYSFDLETLKKQNISAGIKHLEKLGGASPFIVAYITQSALSGHAIPLDQGALEVLTAVGAITEAEAQSNKPLGLERAIPKSKGIEFASLLHQLAAEYVANPFSPNVKKILTAINPEAKLPKRGVKKEAEPAPAPKKKGAGAEKSSSADKSHATKSHGDKTSDKPAGEKSHGEKAEKLVSNKSHAEKAHGEKSHSEKAHSEKSSEKPKPGAKAPDRKKGSAQPAKSQGGADKTRPAPVSAKPKPPNKQLTKRKPR